MGRKLKMFLVAGATSLVGLVTSSYAAVGDNLLVDKTNELFTTGITGTTDLIGGAAGTPLGYGIAIAIIGVLIGGVFFLMSKGKKNNA